jgi:catechol 2,3-dioxygenase-like lactoylglutathione lyase family enzyme
VEPHSPKKSSDVIELIQSPDRFFNLMQSKISATDATRFKQNKTPLPVSFSVEHIAIPATDPVALRNWYEHALGAQPVWDDRQSSSTCLLALSNLWLEIYAAKALPPGRGNNKLAGFRHVALRVDSIDAAKAELAGRGVKFEEEIRPAAGGGRVLFFNDCEGNLLHLVERPEDFL